MKFFALIFLIISVPVYSADKRSFCDRYLASPVRSFKEKVTGLFVKTPQKIKVALCQIDTTVGDFDFNTRHMLRFVEKAAEAKADMAVFSEAVFSSYPPRDLLDRKDFLANNEKALDRFLEEVQKIPNAPKTIILGSIVRSQKPTGRELQNAALAIEDGKVVHRQDKQLLPTYDVFDDARYFEPGTESKLWKSQYGKVGCVVCEDAWYAGSFRERPLYKKDPAEMLKGSSLVVSVNASPYEKQKQDVRKEILSQFAQRTGAPLIYVNQVGAQDDILFDGDSAIYSESGERLFKMPSFKESIGIVDLEFGKTTRILSSKILNWDKAEYSWQVHTQYSDPSPMKVLEDALVSGIRGYFTKVGYEKAVLGLSGGVDSSVVATLLAKALGPENVIGVAMPSKYNDADSITDAKALANNLGIKYIEMPIKTPVATMMTELGAGFNELVTRFALPTTQEDTTEDNIQARLRAVILTGIANKFDALVIPTSNKSENSVSQTTMYGDSAGALAPIGDLLKLQVYEFARYLNQDKIVIPQNVFIKPASAQLAPGQTDEAKFGPWTMLDPVLEMYIEKLMSEEEIIAQGYDADYVYKIIKIVKAAEFKRNQAAIILKVSPKAFGTGRRIPVSNFYRPVREKK